MSSSLFTECFGADGCEAQSGCGIASIGQPILDEFKKTLLEAGTSVIKKLRKKKQVGNERPKNKKKVQKKVQKGAGVRKNKKQKNKQKGRGIKRKGQVGRGGKKPKRK